MKMFIQLIVSQTKNQRHLQTDLDRMGLPAFLSFILYSETKSHALFFYKKKKESILLCIQFWITLMVYPYILLQEQNSGNINKVTVARQVEGNAFIPQQNIDLNAAILDTILIGQWSCSHSLLYIKSHVWGNGAWNQFSLNYPF